MHRIPIRAVLLLALALAAISCDNLDTHSSRGSGDVEPKALDSASIMVGAHYYLWFPSRFDGYLRQHLLPPQQPLIGEYSSTSSLAAEQHIEMAASAGIDFFTMDYWPGLDQQNRAMERGFLKARNISRMRFCIFYETWNLGFDLDTGATVMDEQAISMLLSDIDLIAARYFGHPSYLRIEGRPVLILYLTRTMVGDVSGAIRRLRERARQKGFDPFIIGDEIFWVVTPPDAVPVNEPIVTGEPQIERIELFDAITAYNLYESMTPSHAGFGSRSRFLEDSRALYERYRDAVGDRVPIVPLAMPGYNDRGVRPAENHYAIPRQWSPAGGEGSFFSEMLDRFTLPLVDRKLPMFLITSWNEWSEDTAIEPLGPSPRTAVDVSRSGKFYTQGFAYEGYGTAYLDVLRSKLR